MENSLAVIVNGNNPSVFSPFGFNLCSPINIDKKEYISFKIGPTLNFFRLQNIVGGSNGQKVHMYSISHRMFWKMWEEESSINRGTAHLYHSSNIYFLPFSAQFNTDLSIGVENRGSTQWLFVWSCKYILFRIEILNWLFGAHHVLVFVLFITHIPWAMATDPTSREGIPTSDPPPSFHLYQQFLSPVYSLSYAYITGIRVFNSFYTLFWNRYLSYCFVPVSDTPVANLVSIIANHVNSSYYTIHLDICCFYSPISVYYTTIPFFVLSFQCGCWGYPCLMNSPFPQT